MIDLQNRITELKEDRRRKLDTLQRSLKTSIEKGYDFAGPNLNIFAHILQLEAQLRELEGVEKY